MPASSAREDGDGIRSALYGLLSHLFFAAPTPELLRQIADLRDVIGEAAGELHSAWQTLADAARQADVAAIRSEFDDTFVSTGRPPVSLYASSYMQGRRKGHLLAELREDLLRLGYRRADEAVEYEDHISALCDVMRGLIVDDAAPEMSFAAQQAFFRHYLAPWFAALCIALDEAGQTSFYRSVSRFAAAFFANESEYFELA
ncbi:MAG: molecular chaperone TorD family protein [Burkholderiales bacterium]|nr:molecular chaperone TorD family protein [Burkholderiales bacterium]